MEIRKIILDSRGLCFSRNQVFFKFGLEIKKIIPIRHIFQDITITIRMSRPVCVCCDIVIEREIGG